MKTHSRIADILCILAIAGTVWGMIWIFPVLWLIFMHSLQSILPDRLPLSIEHGFVFFLPLPCCLGSAVILLLNRKDRLPVGALFLFLLNAEFLLLYLFFKLLL